MHRDRLLFGGLLSVIVNIIAYHVTMQRIGAELAVLATICWVFLFWRYRHSFAPLWVAKVDAK